MKFLLLTYIFGFLVAPLYSNHPLDSVQTARLACRWSCGLLGSFGTTASVTNFHLRWTFVEHVDVSENQ